MAMFSVRVPDELAARFDVAAEPLGGRSARLRQLIAQAAGDPPGQPPAGRRPRSGSRIMVRLDAADTAEVEAEAAALCLSRSAWIAGLVRRRVRGAPTFGRPDALALIAIQTELRRIGVNVNQIARALNTAVLEGRVLDLQLGQVEDLAVELRAHVVGVREAVAGNLAYWDVGP